MFLSILNNDSLYNNTLFPEKYKSLKFESYSGKNTKYEYENGEIVIFFAGSIYNTEKLLHWLNIHNSDTQRISSSPDIIVHIYKNYGFNYMMNVVDGVFSLVLLDQRVNVPESKMYIMRDEVGLMPLFMMIPNNDSRTDNNNNNNNNIYRFLPDNNEKERPLHIKMSNLLRAYSTNQDAIMDLCSGLNSGGVKPKYIVKDIPLGCYWKFSVSNKVSCFWEVTVPPMMTNTLRYCKVTSVNKKTQINENVRNYLCDAIEKRVNSLNNTIILCVVDVNNFESLLIACIINQFLISNKTSNCLDIIFTECNNYSLYLKTIFTIHKCHFLPKDAEIMGFIKKTDDVMRTTLFSNLFLTVNNDVRSKKSFMEIDKELKKSLFELHKTIDRNCCLDIEYPLLDSVWLQYYLSIDLEHKPDLIQESFNFYEFEGYEGLFTLE
jgi:hypothetical protein